MHRLFAALLLAAAATPVGVAAVLRSRPGWFITAWLLAAAPATCKAQFGRVNQILNRGAAGQLWHAPCTEQRAMGPD